MIIFRMLLFILMNSRTKKNILNITKKDLFDKFGLLNLNTEVIVQVYASLLFCISSLNESSACRI